jgi:hypothetical protein
MHFTVSADVVVTLDEFSERLGSHAYDLVVAEETQALELLHRSKILNPAVRLSGKSNLRESGSP